MTLSGRFQTRFFIIGILFVSVGLVFNIWTTQKIILWLNNTSGLIIPLTVMDTARIWIFNIAFVFVGLTLILLKYRSNSHLKLFSDVSLGIFFTVIILVFIEGLFFALNGGNGEGRHIYITQLDGQPGTFYQEDELLGYRLVPDNQIHVVEVSQEETIYEATYTVNEYGRRMTSVENPEHRPHHILFFGDSFTFGYGVNDNETLPFFVGQFAPAYQPHNYGISGQGPQQLFAMLQDERVTEGISRQDSGHVIGIYTFIDKHIYRAIGSMKMHNRRGDVSPYYVLHDTELVRKGTLVSGRPILSIVYPLLGSSQTIRYFQFDFPAINDGHLRLTTKMIAEARNNFAERFNSEEFYIVLYPSNGKLLIPYLETAGLEYLDYSDLFSPPETGLSIPSDGHPTPQAYKILAEQLTRDLGIYDYKTSE